VSSPPISKNKKAALLGAALVVNLVSSFALAFAQQVLFLMENNKANNEDEAKDE
jgi:hypothetical protein